MTQQRKAMLLMATCACLWSIGGIFIKLVSWNTFLIASCRSFLAAIVLAVFMYITKTKINVCKYSIGAGFCLSGVMICFVAANKLTTAANAIVLQSTAPIFILIIAILFLHQKIDKKQILIVSATTVGIVFFFFDQLSPGNITGNLLAILAGLLLGTMYTLIGVGGGEDDSIRMTGILIGHILTAIIGFPVGFPLTDSFAGSEFVCILILGIFQLGIPYVLYALASKDCSPLACSLIGMLEPLLNPVWVFIFDGEAPGFYALIGAAIVVVSVTTWCIIGKSEEDPEETVETT